MRAGAGELPVTPMTPAHVAALSVAVVACGIDLRTRRIPNVLTFGAAAIALAFQFAVGGTSGLGIGISGWAVGVLMLLAQYALGGMGAGDLKLLGAIGAWLGPGDTFWVAIYGCMAGGVMAIVVAGTRGYLRQACSNVWLMLTHWRVVGPRPLPGLTLATSGGPRLAYAAPILVGTIVTLWLR